MIKIASWNVNSLKVRLDQVLEWLDTSNTDVLALQETKLTDEFFPEAAFVERGYHVVYSGQKTYNGVAIISRFPIEGVVKDIPDLDDPQRRVLACTIKGYRVINLYIPNGASPDSDKYQYKLHWLEKLHDWLQAELAEHPHLIVLGDFNIAPADIDVHDPSVWAGGVMVSPLEREAFQGLLSLGLIDSFRHQSPEAKAYSWWDYRAAGFRRNRGLRIDLILLGRLLIDALCESSIDIEPRRVERPSDHTPVWISLEQKSS